MAKIPTITQCDHKGREDQTVVADLDGTLLIGRSSFGYFALVAFDLGGILRLLFLLLLSPLAGFLYHFVSEAAGIRVLIFAAFAGAKLSGIKSAASAVLPKFYSEDLHPDTWRVFSSCGKRCVVTANPRIMVEPFLKNYLGVDVVLGTEVSSWRGYATGLTARLRRDRAQDARLIETILQEGRYLVMCPEGTTCREPYLLRFSSLFAELTDEIVPVAIRVRTSLFHGTTARGYKWLDPFFFFMNPVPRYEVTFLEKLPREETCVAGKSSYEVANNVQHKIAKTLNYKCTKLTRKDKYRALAGTDGIVGQTPAKPTAKVAG
ncbi:Glycerol-3-phosphate acyltransferase 5 [Striga hermonthica]|uniref:Glycerol-3-phosphate acyltransferase 5 n=1 Tax=Striga hermonthica TaxID=68872 RepID=A0A9N7R1Z6_STRHE|nr:Glycerol-3-phosphate acyltransferase 5 [Striga hermonthica]